MLATRATFRNSNYRKYIPPMSDVHAEASHLQVFIHRDDETPWEFVVGLLRSIFKMPAAKAANFADTMEKYGQAVCGTYQRDAANKLVEAARQNIKAIHS